MNATALLRKLLVVTLVFAFLLAPLYSVSARTVDEINADIKNSQEQLAKLKAEIDSVNKDIAANQTKKNSSTSEINKIRLQITELENAHKLALLQKQQLETEIIAKNLEKEEREKALNEELVHSYITWKTDQANSAIFSDVGDMIKSMMYYEFLANESTKGLIALSENINSLNQQTVEFQAQANTIEQNLGKLNEEKAFWEKQIQLYNEALAKAGSSKTALVSSSSQLEAQQKQYNFELERAVAAVNSGSEPLVTGEIYFTGSVSLPRNGIECTGGYKYSGFDPGSEAFGHGIGMSQWGAYGAAYAGKTAAQILTFYFSGTRIETRPAKTIKVNGVDAKSMEDYVAGIGEVPSKACGTMEKIQAWNEYANTEGWAANDPRREKYLLGGNCWPEEAIKAQVIAARTYAYNRSDSICTTDACQVYIGGFAKAWAAYETKDQVILSGDTIIDAFYSGYNNNGAGTADIETVWPKSPAKSYLKSVNDNSFTYTPRLCNQNVSRQNWRTNSYSISDIEEMLNWAQEKSNWGDYNFVEKNYWNADAIRNQVKNVIGKLVALQVENDASGRAKKVTFVGDRGSGSVSGIFFRMTFNSWAGRTGKNDGLKSITYDALKVQ